jgi:hypothetical protein
MPEDISRVHNRLKSFTRAVVAAAFPVEPPVEILAQQLANSFKPARRILQLEHRLVTMNALLAYLGQLRCLVCRRSLCEVPFNFTGVAIVPAAGVAHVNNADFSTRYHTV